MLMVLSSWAKSLQEFARFISWMQTERRVAANRQIKPTDLGWESAENSQLPSTSTTAIVVITQPVSWYSFYRPTKGERFTWPEGSMYWTRMHSGVTCWRIWCNDLCCGDAAVRCHYGSNLSYPSTSGLCQNCPWVGLGWIGSHKVDPLTTLGCVAGVNSTVAGEVRFTLKNKSASGDGRHRRGRRGHLEVTTATVNVLLGPRGTSPSRRSLGKQGCHGPQTPPPVLPPLKLL